MAILAKKSLLLKSLALVGYAYGNLFVGLELLMERLGEELIFVNKLKLIFLFGLVGVEGKLVNVDVGLIMFLMELNLESKSE